MEREDEAKKSLESPLGSVEEQPCLVSIDPRTKPGLHAVCVQLRGPGRRVGAG